jgi:uncharacterized protein (TIGR03118 family)
VTIPGGLPTGTVANPVATEFVLPGACASAPCGANFLFASITGNIVGWDPNAPGAGSTTGVIAASHPGHVYTGLAYANNGSGNFIYAADFANGTIDVYNASFALQPAASFPFVDPTIPTTMGNTYHPFNIQAIGGSLYVMYAKVDPMTGLDQEGVGNGFVRRFNANGVRDLTFGINNGALNSPWGSTIAPATFGIFGGALLIGNFGEGNPSIHAYNPTTGAFLGTLQNEAGDGIVIDELWDLKFGNDINAGSVNTLYFSAGIGEEEHGLFGKLNPTTASATSLIQFSTDEYSITEAGGHIDVTVTRAGDVSGSATVNYNTFDVAEPDHASQKSDYEIALGSVSFAPGETSKTFRILLLNDTFDENDETIDLYLSNPTGAGVGLGSPSTAEVKILDNDTGAPATNPIDDAAFFVRQHYLAFLNREPDSAGLTFWTNTITSCGAVPACIEVRRVNVSAAFFLSSEFQSTGYLAYLTHRSAFGATTSGSPAPVLYGNFMRDVQALQRGYVFGQSGADAVLEANTVAYFNEFVTRPEFVFKYPAFLTNDQYVDSLLTSATLPTTGSFRDSLVAGLNAATQTRATVLRAVALSATLQTREFNAAFVTMEYFGYLRRDPDTSGFNFWLNKLNSFGGNYIAAELVRAFISSSEYRQEFGPSFAGPFQAFSKEILNNAYNYEATPFDTEATTTTVTPEKPATDIPGQRPPYTPEKLATERAGNDQTLIVSLAGNPLVLPFASTGVSISGHLFNPAGRLLKAAEVTIKGGDLNRSTATDASGNYHFDNLPAGDYTLTVRSRKYTFASKTVVVSNDLKDVDLRAKP